MYPINQVLPSSHMSRCDEVYTFPMAGTAYVLQQNVHCAQGGQDSRAIFPLPTYIHLGKEARGPGGNGPCGGTANHQEPLLEVCCLLDSGTT